MSNNVRSCIPSGEQLVILRYASDAEASTIGFAASIIHPDILSCASDVLDLASDQDTEALTQYLI